MRKSVELIKKGFESSSETTPEFLEFFRVFKSEFKKELEGVGATKIEIFKGHFYCYGFFTMPSGQIWYFNLNDVRWFDWKMLYRTASSYHDWRGGSNQWVSFEVNMVLKMNIR